MEMLKEAIDVMLHLDAHLNEWIGATGNWFYVLMFLVIFCETGLVVTPFLPGDSLLFALGALTTTENAALSLPVLLVSLTAAGIIGDAVNYSCGRWIGPKVFTSETSRFLKRDHLLKAQAFFERHGGKAIIFARFAPIVRTFVPFVAGIGRMHYPRFALFNVVGAIAWVAGFLLAGHYFGNIPAVKRNFHIVIFGIIGVSLLPIVIEFFRARAASKTPAAGA